MTPVRDLNDLYFFAKVADFGSYTAAAKALGLQTSKLSRRIAALEGELGVRLINRTTRRLSLTEAGKTFHRHCLALLDATNRRVDVVDEGLDIAMRVRKPPLEDSDLAMLALGPDEMILVASPELIVAHGEPQTLEDIGRMPTLSMGGADERSTWRFVGMEGEPAELIHLPRLCTDDLFTLRRAALQGIGAVLIPRLAVANDLEGGTLVRLLPSLKAHVGVMHAVFPSRRGMIPAVRALLDLLAETVRLLPS
jgi:DNA-binding transcriptional LysR family regulator